MINKKVRLEELKKENSMEKGIGKYDLFLQQEDDICQINKENFAIREQKFLQYGTSYWNFYKEFGLMGMITDIYRKTDRLKNMAKAYTEEDIKKNQKEIQDQYYDLINYCYLQLFFLRENYWKTMSKFNTLESTAIRSAKIDSSIPDNYDYKITEIKTHD